MLGGRRERHEDHLQRQTYSRDLRGHAQRENELENALYLRPLDDSIDLYPRPAAKVVERERRLDLQFRHAQERTCFAFLGC